MKIDLIFLVVLLIIVIYQLCSCNNITEKFDNTTINTVDIESIRNLGSIANKLMNGDSTSNSGVIVPGPMKVSGNMNTTGVISTNGKTNLPNGWGGGLRTWDIYGSGTLGWGKDDATPLTMIFNDGSVSFAGGKVTIDANGNVVINGNLTVNGNISLPQSSNYINTPAIKRIDGDWLRINEGGNGKIAMYGHVNVGENGLVVGDWTDGPGKGNVKINGDVKLSTLTGSTNNFQFIANNGQSYLNLGGVPAASGNCWNGVQNWHFGCNAYNNIMS